MSPGQKNPFNLKPNLQNHPEVGNGFVTFGLGTWRDGQSGTRGVAGDGGYGGCPGTEVNGSNG